MSSIYNTEPQPTASVILHTTHGDLSVELFAKQTPLTCRNFLQHCLDGYYDNTIFHRLVPGFILQGGDPTGTGNGGESIYDRGAFSGDLDPWPLDQRRGKNAGPTGVNFKDEFHSRLKFNRRGLLGMANEGLVDSNGSQFFFTLDRTAELDGKNTMFGRVAGDTIYNLAKMGEAEVEEGGERPLYPTKVTGVEILVNPFEDMKKRDRVAQRTAQPAAPAKKKDKKRKGGKQLLSFGDDEGEGDIEPLPKKPKFDTRIVMMDVDEEKESAPKSKKSKASRKDKDVKDLGTTSVPIREAPAREAPSREPSPPPKASKKTSDKVRVKDEVESSPEPEQPKEKSELERTNEEIAAIKASLKRNVQSSEPVKQEKKKTALEQMIPETSTRGRKRRAGGNNPTPAEERKALAFLESFRSKLEQAPPEKVTGKAPSAAENGEAPKDDAAAEVAAAADDEDAEVCDLHFIANCQSCKAWDKAEEGEKDGEKADDEGWMSHSLSFAADKLGKDLSYRKKAEEELVVIDPLAKARNLKAERKGGRGGSSGRAWDDLARNAQMARNSSLAGRGAK